MLARVSEFSLFSLLEFIFFLNRVKELLLFFFVIDKIERERVRVPHLRPEPLDSIRMEDLIKDYLTSKDNVCTSLLRVGQIIF